MESIPEFEIKSKCPREAVKCLDLFNRASKMIGKYNGLIEEINDFNHNKNGSRVGALLNIMDRYSRIQCEISELQSSILVYTSLAIRFDKNQIFTDQEIAGVEQANKILEKVSDKDSDIEKFINNQKEKMKVDPNVQKLCMT